MLSSNKFITHHPEGYVEPTNHTDLTTYTNTKTI